MPRQEQIQWNDKAEVEFQGSEEQIGGEKQREHRHTALSRDFLYQMGRKMGSGWYGMWG